MNLFLAVSTYIGAFVIICWVLLMTISTYVVIRDQLQIRKAKKLDQLPLYEQKAYEARKYEEME